MAAIKETTRNLANTLGEGFTIGDAGTGTFAEGVFDKTLETTGLDRGQFQSAVDHLGNITAAGGLVVAENALGYLKANPGIDSVTATLPGVKGLDFEFTQYREALVPNGDKNNPGMVTSYGRLVGKVHLAGAGNRGQHKAVRDHARTIFREEFEKKS